MKTEADNSQDIIKRYCDHFYYGSSILPYIDKMKRAHALTEELIGYIETACRQQEGLSNGNGSSDSLYPRLLAYRNEMLGMIWYKYRQAIWSENEFMEMYILGFFASQERSRDTAMLPYQLIVELRQFELDIVAGIFSEVSISDFRFEIINAKVFPKSSILFAGEDYQADVIVGPGDSRLPVEIRVGLNVDTTTMEIQGPVQKIDYDRGVGKLRIRADSPGLKTYGGTCSISSACGSMRVYPFSGTFLVIPRTP
jgi:hypothetical protein